MCDWLDWSEHKKAPSFVSFDDLVPSRYAMSFIEPLNPNAYNVNVAFIALDAENLGELVNHSYHTDFGDNVLPYFKSNTNQSITLSSDSSEDEDDISEDYKAHCLSDEDVERIHKYIPPSVLRYLN
jgi:hypothetical protein